MLDVFLQMKEKHHLRLVATAVIFQFEERLQSDVVNQKLRSSNLNVG